MVDVPVSLMWVLGISFSVLSVLIGLFWKHLDRRFDELQQMTTKTAAETEALRREVYREFVRQGDHDKVYNAIQGVYERLNTLDRSMNTHIQQLTSTVSRLVGQTEATRGERTP